jgi:flagellar motor switch protein FliN/FliY
MGPIAEEKIPPAPGCLRPIDREARQGRLREELRRIVHAAAQVTPKLAQLIEEFWGLPAEARLLSASPRTLYFWRSEDFYVSQVATGDVSEQNIQLRLSDSACTTFFTRILGESEMPFRLSQVSPFEAHLLSEFTKQLFTILVTDLVKLKSPKKTAKNNGSKKSAWVHLIWSMQLGTPDPDTQPATGKLILSLPVRCIRLPELKAPPRSVLDDTFFYDAHVRASIRVGITRLPLDDLRQLEAGDMLILERSNAGRMMVVDPDSGLEAAFTAEIPNRHQLEVPYTQEIAMMETQHAQSLKNNLWDNLMIDVFAEFQPTRMPLRQLKQMSEGLIVEVGDLVHNKIRLHVEGKTLAEGELVIVGDKFGVLIHEVESAAPNAQAAPDMIAPVAAPQVEMPAEEPPALPPMAQMPDAMPDEQPQPAAESEAALDDFLDDDFDDDNFSEEDEW